VTTTIKPHTTYQFQTELTLEALKKKPDMRNQELNAYVRNRLTETGHAAPQFVSNSVFTRARNQLGIVSTRGRPAGSKNVKAKEEEVAPAPVPSTGIYTGFETLQVAPPVVAAPSLQDLLRPIEKLMRENGISSLTLWNEGLRVKRTVSESLVF
jgi:hypothetical protein